MLDKLSSLELTAVICLGITASAVIAVSAVESVCLAAVRISLSRRRHRASPRRDAAVDLSKWSPATGHEDVRSE